MRAIVLSLPLLLTACVDAPDDEIYSESSDALSLPDGALVQNSVTSELFVNYGGARFAIPTQFEREQYAGMPIIFTPATIAMIPTIPIDGTVLRERSSLQPFVMIGGSRFRLNNTNIFNGPQRVVPDGTLLAIPQTPHDGMVVKEVSFPKVYVVTGDVASWIPDEPELVNHFGGWGAVQLVPDGSLELYRNPRPGTLFLETNGGAVYVFEPDVQSRPGAHYGITDPTMLQAYGGWGGVKIVPRDTIATFPDGGIAPSNPSIAVRPNLAGVLRRTGKIATDIDMASLPAAHTVMLRFQLQFPRAREQCLFSTDSEGPGSLSLTHTADGKLRLRVGGDWRDYPLPSPDRATGFQVPSIGFPTAAPPIVVPRWHHVAVANTSTGYRVYADGVQLTSLYDGRPGSDGPMFGGARSGRLQLGQYPLPIATQAQFQMFGLVDDLAVFNAAVAQSTINAIANMPRLTGLEPNLAASVSFDSAFGSPSGIAVDHTPTFVAQSWPTTVSANRDARADQAVMPLPYQSTTYQLPFKPGEVWHVAQEFASEYSHQSWFAWDFGRVPASIVASHANGSATGPFDDLTPTEANRVLAVAPGTIIDMNQTAGASQTITWQTAADEHVFYEHLRPGTFRFNPGASVTAMTVMAQAGASGMPGYTSPHLHMSAHEAIGTTTLSSIPITFAGYEVSRDYGRTWQSVASGMPRVGEWIRRPGSPLQPSDPLCSPGFPPWFLAAFGCY